MQPNPEVWAELVAARMLNEPWPYDEEVWKQCSPGDWMPQREERFFNDVCTDHELEEHGFHRSGSALAKYAKLMEAKHNIGVPADATHP